MRRPGADVRLRAPFRRLFRSIRALISAVEKNEAIAPGVVGHALAQTLLGQQSGLLQLLFTFGFAFGLELAELIHVLVDGPLDPLLVRAEELELFGFAQVGVGGIESGFDAALSARAGFGQDVGFGGPGGG